MAGKKGADLFTPILLALGTAVAASLLLSARWEVYGWLARQLHVGMLGSFLVFPMSEAAMNDKGIMTGVVLCIMVLTIFNWLAFTNSSLWSGVESMLYYKWQRLAFRHLLLSLVQANVMVFMAKTTTILCAGWIIPESAAGVGGEPAPSSLLPLLLHTTASMLWLACNTPMLVDDQGRSSANVKLFARLFWFFGLGFMRVAPWVPSISTPSLLVQAVVEFPLPLLALGVAAALPSMLLGPSLVQHSKHRSSFNSLLLLTFVNVGSTLWATRVGAAMGQAMGQVDPPLEETGHMVSMLVVVLLCTALLGLAVLYAHGVWTLLVASPLVACEWYGLSLVGMEVRQQPKLVSVVHSLFTTYWSHVAALLGWGGSTGGEQESAPSGSEGTQRLLLHLLQLSHEARTLFTAKQVLRVRLRCTVDVHNTTALPATLSKMQLRLLVRLQGRTSGPSTLVRMRRRSAETNAMTPVYELLVILLSVGDGARRAWAWVSNLAAALLPPRVVTVLTSTFGGLYEDDVQCVEVANVSIAPVTVLPGRQRLPVVLTAHVAGREVLQLLHQLSTGGRGVEGVDVLLTQASSLAHGVVYTTPLVTITPHTVWAAVDSTGQKVASVASDVDRLTTLQEMLSEESQRLVAGELQGLSVAATEALQKLAAATSRLQESAVEFDAQVAETQGVVGPTHDAALEAVKNNLLMCVISLLGMKLQLDQGGERSQVFEAALFQFAQGTLGVFGTVVMASLYRGQGQDMHVKALYSFGAAVILALLQAAVFPHHAGSLVADNLAPADAPGDASPVSAVTPLGGAAAGDEEGGGWASPDPPAPLPGPPTPLEEEPADHPDS